MFDGLCCVSHLSVTSCLVLGVAAAAAVECQLAGNGFKCLLPVFKYILRVMHSSDASHIIVFTLFCLNPV